MCILLFLPLIALSTFCLSLTINTEHIMKNIPPNTSTKHVVNNAYWSDLKTIVSEGDDPSGVIADLNTSESWNIIKTISIQLLNI